MRPSLICQWPLLPYSPRPGAAGSYWKCSVPACSFLELRMAGRRKRKGKGVVVPGSGAGERSRRVARSTLPTSDPCPATGPTTLHHATSPTLHCSPASDCTRHVSSPSSSGSPHAWRVFSPGSTDRLLSLLQGLLHRRPRTHIRTWGLDYLSFLLKPLNNPKLGPVWKFRRRRGP